MKEVKIIRINKEIIQNKTLSNEAILSFIGLSMIALSDINSYVSVDIISYYLTNSIKPERKIKDAVRKGLTELSNNKIIKCKHNNNKSIYYVEPYNIFIENNYVIIQPKEIWTILNNKSNNSISLLRFYVNIIGTFIIKNSVQDSRFPDRYNNILGMLPVDYLANISNISKTTAVKYIKRLEDLQLLYIVRCSNQFRELNGTFKRHNNIYGRYSHAKVIDEYASIELKNMNELFGKEKSKMINNSRSMLQKYNNLVKGKEYDQYTIAILFEFILKYNKEHIGKERDVCIFAKYGYDIKNIKTN